MTTPKALVVEDTAEFATLCRALLEREGFEVTVTDRGELGVDLARRLGPELVLLDISLPGIDGFEVCRRLREFSDAYVLMVTGRVDEVDKVVGLTVGADDYVTKPFSAREVSARIAAMQRRPRVTRATGLRDFGPLVVDPAAREARLDGAVLDLTKIEFDILDLLTSSPRRTFSREQVLEAVWGDRLEDDHVLAVHLGNLRRKLGESASRPRFLRTMRGVGYRFDPA